MAETRGRKPKSKVDFQAVNLGTSTEFLRAEKPEGSSAELRSKRTRTAAGVHQCESSPMRLIRSAGRAEKDPESDLLSAPSPCEHLLLQSGIGALAEAASFNADKLSGINALLCVDADLKLGGHDSEDDDSSSDSSTDSSDSTDECSDGPNPEWGPTSQGDKARVRREKQPPPSVLDTSAHDDEMLALANESFEEQFIWSEKKVIAVRSYFAARKTGLSVIDAANIAAIASHSDERSVRSYVADFENNNGWFSPSVWGTNTKTPSLMADVEHRLWARQWVIANMGHKSNGPNKRAIDFQRAAHDHFGYEYDPVSPVISLRCATAWLHTVVGAEVKKGTFVDDHGKDHVVEQRSKFIQWYGEVYARGPNFVLVNDKLIDKDRVKNLLKSGLTAAEHCIGPRGTNLGGGVSRASIFSPLSFIPKELDHKLKIWIIVCHDECCVHTNEGEAFCWKIPGIEMGDCPPKSKGDIIHLADANAELKSGTLSLDGLLGMITRKELRHYIKMKREGKEVPVPKYITVWMHAGSAGEGYWIGEDAMMQFELMSDIFDLIFNMPWVTDLSTATSTHILAITMQQRGEFMYGMCPQIDRSQNHLRRPPDGLNTKNGKGINKGGAPGQPHFRSTRAPLPAGKTHWTQCRERLCSPGCVECEAAAVVHGHHPDFQSVGKKGSNQVLLECGLSTAGSAKDQALLLNSQPNWGQMKSHAIEIFELRYHTCLIGAAYHAELASEEHRWRRLKQLVKPYVDNSVETCVQLILNAWGALDGETTFQDNRSCRETMAAYKALEAAGAEITLAALEAEYNKIKGNHRGVYDSQKDRLMAILAMPQTQEQIKNAQAVQSRVDTAKVRKRKDIEHEAKRESQIRSKRNKALNVKAKGKEGAAKRKAKYKEAHPDKKHKRVKRVHNIFNTD